MTSVGSTALALLVGAPGTRLGEGTAADLGVVTRPGVSRVLSSDAKMGKTLPFFPTYICTCVLRHLEGSGTAAGARLFIQPGVTTTQNNKK